MSAVPMQLPDTASAPPNVVTGGYAYSAPWRIAAAALSALSVAGMLATSALVLWADDPPVTPPILFQLVAVFVLLPAALAWGIRRHSAASIEVDHLTIAVTRRGLRLEVPSQAIDGVLPWLVPLPGPGFSLRMRSGRRLRYGIETAQAAEVLRALAETAEVSAAAAAASHPNVLYAAARAAESHGGWVHAVCKFALFGLLPAAVLFNAHQHITYGGTLGEYYMLGGRSYAATFLTYWATVVIYLVLYAGVWRGAAEAVALAAAWAARASALPARRLVESVCRAAYYGGVPLLLLIRFL
jgi:hypothetical protein